MSDPHECPRCGAETRAIVEEGVWSEETYDSYVCDECQMYYNGFEEKWYDDDN